jgi:hypothetical protein
LRHAGRAPGKAGRAPSAAGPGVVCAEHRAGGPALCLGTASCRGAG